ncbi:MAG: nicotinate phosphoribosyltransferase [Halodesulfurarchaeum sp.]
MVDFDIVSPEAIESGRATDAYFERTITTLEYTGKNPEVVVEVTADQFPTGTFELFAGLKDAIALLEGLPVDVDAIPEGTLFDGGPVLRIRGPYRSFAVFETSLLGFLSHASGIATNALKARLAAPDSVVLSFGARHVHPSIAAVVERSALVGGLDGFSHVAAGDVIGKEAGGTMPHALIIIFGKGNQEAAWRAFDDAVDSDVPRVALCDTFTDEVDESLRAADTLGDALESVRLDTTASRRGDFRDIVRETRWELDVRGYEDVDIFVSGGLEPSDLRHLSDVADGFGVGGFISNADPVDFALDIVEVEGEPVSKRGKLAGTKQVYRSRDGGHHVIREDLPGPTDGEALLKPAIRDGEVVTEFSLDAAIDRAERDAARVEPEWDSTE